MYVQYNLWAKTRGLVHVTRGLIGMCKAAFASCDDNPGVEQSTPPPKKREEKKGIV